MQNLPPSNVISVDFSKKNKVRNEPSNKIRDAIRHKLSIFNEFLQAGIVSVSLDPRAFAVKIPARFRSQNSLLLNFSYGFRIDDFSHDEQGVRATLMFPEGHYFCSIPWDSVFALHSEEMQRSVFFDRDVSSRRGLSLVSNDLELEE